MAGRRPVLLVHGAFRGGWAWSRVRPALLDAGFDVWAPSLAGCGERHDGQPVETLAAWSDELVRLVVSEDLTDVVLVGHSQGALVAAAVAAAIPERIGVLVHLDGAIPDPGERAVDLGGGTLDVLPARGVWVPFGPVVVSDEWDPQSVEWVNARLTPTPVGPSLDVVPSVPNSVREVFVFADGTPSGFPSALSRRRRQERGLPFVSLDCGHDVPLVAPDLAVRSIIAAARGSDSSAGSAVIASGD